MDKLSVFGLIVLPIFVALLALMIWALTGEKGETPKRTNGREEPIPLNRDGTGAYSCQPPYDPERSKVADDCFLATHYCFWNDIFHYGGRKGIPYPSPEQWVWHLYQTVPKEVKEKHENDDPEDDGLCIRNALLDCYAVMVWYIDMMDRSVFSLFVGDGEFLGNAQEDMDNCNFLGFSWIGKEEIEERRGDPETYSEWDWLTPAEDALNADAGRFEAAVQEFTNYRVE